MDDGSARSRRLRAVVSWTFALAAGALGTWRYHLPEFRSRFELFFGDRGDARFITYICEHWYQALAGRAALLSPRMFHPVEGTLGYSDLLVGYALPYSLLRALGVEMFSAMQVVVILFNFLSFVLCFVLLHRVLRLGAIASCAAALFFAFSSPKFAQLGHLQMQFTLALPLSFILLIAFARPSTKRTRLKDAAILVLAVLAFHLQLLTTFYYGWFFAFWSLLFLASSLVFASTRRFLLQLARRSWRALACGVAFLLAGLIPFLAVYLPVARSTAAWEYPLIVAMIPAPRDFLQMALGNRIWGKLGESLRQPYFGELQVGLGLIPTLGWAVLTAIAIATAFQRPGSRDSRTGKLFLVAMVLATTLFFVLGMKYGGGASPWRYVHELVPGGTAVRAVARYVLFLTLPMAIAFAWAIDRALRWAARRPSRAGALAACGAIVVVAYAGVGEQFGFRRGFSKINESLYLEDLASKLRPDCEAFYLAPAPPPRSTEAEHQYDAMMVSILTGVPTLNGLSSKLPPGWDLLSLDPGYEDNVRRWVARQHVEGRVCRLTIDVPIDAIEANLPETTGDREFVRRQYLDFTAREPTAAELAQWMALLETCPKGDPTCDRIEVSSRIFRSPELLDRGDFLFRLYRAALDRPPRYREFRADLARLGRLLGSAPSEADAKLAVARELVERDGGDARAEEALQRAESARSAEVDPRTLVTLHYFAYLRRDPGEGLHIRLDRFRADGDRRALTAGFLKSYEYRARLRD